MSNLPLRTAQEQIAFCDGYFESVGAACIRVDDHYREYELPRDVDKELTDRPYYWLWVEQTGQIVPPTVLRLAFSDEAVARENERLRAEAFARADVQAMTEVERMFFRPPTAEYVTLGSFRLDKLFASIDQRGRFASIAVSSVDDGQGPDGAIELVRQPANPSWVPWLLLNTMVSLRCDSVQQEWLSIGICLENGQIVERFFPAISRLPFHSVPASTLLERATLDVTTAMRQAEQFLQRRVARHPTDWARQALHRLDQEQRQLQTYYQSILPDVQEDERALLEDEQQRKLEQLRERTEPKIELDIKQVALVGLVAPGDARSGQ